MKAVQTRHRIKIPNRIAVLAAIMLLVSSVVGTGEPDAPNTMAQQLNDTVVEGAVTELATVAAAVSKPAASTISSLIFRF